MVQPNLKSCCVFNVIAKNLLGVLILNLIQQILELVRSVDKTVDEPTEEAPKDVTLLFAQLGQVMDYPVSFPNER
jgi:hypothetical protein